ncbi:MAG TPA: DNA gyrase inhibitor YacG [Burkholderiales bacterium]|nr:DNA gyrase inhibitor YacG [Burkholderiales bacterium]
MGKIRTVACPRCGKQVAWDPGNAYRPFCSERCKLFDLGAWATEQYRVPVQEEKGEPDSDEKR